MVLRECDLIPIPGEEHHPIMLAYIGGKVLSQVGQIELESLPLQLYRTKTISDGVSDG